MLTTNKSNSFLSSLITFAVIFLITINARADAFNDAVNLYLKGFEYCTQADSYSQQGQYSAAREALHQYRNQTARAVAIDASILSTSQREMDSNIRYCKRIETGLEIALGEPLLNKAVEQCDIAQQDLDANRLDSALSSMEKFHQSSQAALQEFPALKEVYSARSNISRCNRLSEKLNRLSQQQSQITLAIADAKKHFDQYQNQCSQVPTTGTIDALEDNNAMLQEKFVQSSRVKNKLAELPGFAKDSQDYHAALVSYKAAEKCYREYEAQIQTRKTELAAIAAQKKKKPERPVRQPVSQAKTKIQKQAPKPPSKPEPIALTDLSGTLTFESDPPKFGVLYFNQDTTKTAFAPVNITIRPSGFDQPLYTVEKFGSFTLSSDDFAFHRISLSVPELNIKKNLAWLQSRQRKTIKIDWPENTIARIDSDRAGIPPAYIAHVSSNELQLLEIGEQRIGFTLPKEHRQQSGYLLIPGFQPVILKGLEKANTEYAVDLVRDEKIQGKLVLQ